MGHSVMQCQKIIWCYIHMKKCDNLFVFALKTLVFSYTECQTNEIKKSDDKYNATKNIFFMLINSIYNTAAESSAL